MTSNPAKMLRLEKIGSLQVGREADVTALDALPGRFELADNSGVKMTASEMIVPAFSLRAGRRHDVSSPLVPQPMRAAAWPGKTLPPRPSPSPSGRGSG